VDRSSLTPEFLAGAIRELLAAEGLTERLAQLGRKADDGLERIASLVEEAASARSLGRPSVFGVPHLAL
jgi:hypothetical protein